MKLVFLLALTLLLAQSFASTECTVSQLQATGSVPLATSRMEYNKTYELRSGNLDVDSLNLKAQVDLVNAPVSPDEWYESPVLTVKGYNPYRFKNKYSSYVLDPMTMLLVNKRSQETYQVKCVVPGKTQFFARTAQGNLFYDKELNYTHLRSAQCFGGKFGKVVTSLNTLSGSFASENEVLYHMKGKSAGYTANGEVTWTEKAKKCVTTHCEPTGDLPRCDTVCSDLNQDRVYTLPRCD